MTPPESTTPPAGTPRWLRLSQRETAAIAGCLIGFALLTTDVLAGGLVTRLDASIMSSLPGPPGPAWAKPVAGVGAAGVSVTVLGVVTLMVIQRVWHWWPLAVCVATTATTGLGVWLTKLLVGREPPPGVPERADYPGYFPSGHTATAMVCLGAAAYVVLAARQPGPMRPDGGAALASPRAAGYAGVLVGLVAGVAVGGSTVATGSHWPSDVAGSLLFGTAVLTAGFGGIRVLLHDRGGIRREPGTVGDWS